MNITARCYYEFMKFIWLHDSLGGLGCSENAGNGVRGIGEPLGI